MDIEKNSPKSNKRKKLAWLIGGATIAFVVICLVLFVIIGSYAGIRAFLVNSPEELSVRVTSPTTFIAPGDEFQIQVSLTNDGKRNIVLNEIELPVELVKNALVTKVSPSASGQFGEMGMTTYTYDLTIAPSGEETIIFEFLAINPGDVQGNIRIRTQSTTESSGFRVFISRESAVEDDETEPENESTDSLEMMVGSLIPYQSVVQITAVVEVNGEFYEGWTGSGTIISEDGLILTNAHVVLSDRIYDVVDLVVAITREQDAPPEQMFFADVVQADENLDLAVIKVRSNLSGGKANFELMDIIPVPLGNAESLQLGDGIVIIGYPGIGGDTITLTRGEVSGFTPQDPYGNRAFIKTSATIAGGNSGGLAANLNGELVGVPTQLGTGDAQDLIVDCRALADTNRDGVIDDQDQCVSTGGFINALRPITLALPMIESAKAGEVAIVEATEEESHQEFQPEGTVILEDEFIDNRNEWALGGDDDGRVEIAEEQLVISVGADNYIQWTTLPDVYDQIFMSTNAQFLQSTGDGEAGFVCGLRNSENFTILEVSEDGFYTIWKYENDEYKTLVDWTYSELIDLSSPFELSAYCGPDRLALAINGVLLVETQDQNYLPGNIGLISGTWDTPDVAVAYDDFKILQP